MKIIIKNVVENYSNMIMQIAYQRTLNTSDSEDIIQEVFIKLIKNSEKIKNEEHLKSWLIRVTINACNDKNKNFWNKNRTELDENVAYYDEESKYVFTELIKLKPIYRDIIYLYYYQGYKIREISKILGIKENTVSSNLTRAKKELKDILIEEGEQYEK